MSYVALDVEEAREAARTLSAINGEVDGVLGEVGRICGAVGVTSGAFNECASSWVEISETVINVLYTKADQMQAIEWPSAYDSDPLGLKTGAEQAALERQAAFDAEMVELLEGVIADSPSKGWQAPNDVKPGDPEWDPDLEGIGVWDAATGSVQWRGRSTVTRLQELMYDPTKTAKDEFVVIKLDNGKYLIGLPGVTDLSEPDFPGTLWGATPTNTIRNTLGAARPSHLSADIDDNAYALMVRDFIRRHIPEGADVAIVGHSYGADSAVDIANDPETRKIVNIEAVIAAGYDSEEQLKGLDTDVPILAYQNVNDAVVKGENGLYHPSQIVHSTASGIWNQLTLNPWGLAKSIADQGRDVVNAGRAAVSSRGQVELDIGTKSYGPNQDNVVFEGGTVGHGHDPSNYNDFIDVDDEPAVLDFMALLGDAGYDGEGDAYVVDVSDPG